MRLASRYDQDEVVAAPTHHRGHEVVEGQARNAIVPTRFLRPEPYVLADGRESYASVAAECAIAFRDFVHDRAARPLFFHVAGRDAILLNAAPAGVGDDPSLAPLLRSLAAALPAHQCAYVVARLHFDALPPDNTPAWERPHDPAHARAAAIAASAPRATAIALLTWMPASADLESRMAYADNRDKLKQALGGLDLCLTITDASELDEAIVSVACQAQLRDEAGDPKGVRRLGARHAHLRAGAGRS